MEKVHFTRIQTEKANCPVRRQRKNTLNVDFEKIIGRVCLCALKIDRTYFDK